MTCDFRLAAVIMSTDEILKRGPGFLNVATAGGIQDVSPFLPLLGTEHCEKLVTSALQNGLLYAAATPMTMFGSLGILKAGITLWSSIDIRVFPGPTLLKNAGFVPSGHGKLLLHVAESKRNLYVAEDKLRCILSKKRIRSVEINLLSKDLVVWNVRLIAWTILLSSFGLIPYIYPIYRSLPEEPFETTWVYPLMRIAGCDIIAVTIQLLFQIRILDETYCRIRFHAMDSYFKDHGQSLPPFWDPNERARDILSKLRGLMKTPKHPNMQPNGTDGQTAASVASNSALGQSNSLLPKVDHNAARWRENLSTDVEDRLATSGLGKMSSFAFPAFVAPSRPPSIAPPSPALPSSGALQSPASADDPSAAERGEIAQTQAPPSVCFSDYPPQHFAPITQLGMEPVPSRLLAWVSESFTNVLLWATQLFLFVGIGLTFVGYIGCFTIIQATDRSDWKAPVIWLIVEAALGGIRTVLWAWNPTWDDAKSPIALEKVPSDDSDSLSVDGHSAAGTTTDFANISVEGDAAGDSKKCSYGIGWMLDSVTADDMHALIIAVNKANAKDLEDLDECTADGDRVSEYLQDTLLVPRSQIVKLYDEDATKAKIVEELKALAHRGTVAQDAPIVIYFAGHSFVSEHDNSTYFVPHRSSAEKDDPMEGCSLSYREVVDLLGHIAQEKTDTIVSSSRIEVSLVDSSYSRRSSWIVVMLAPWGRTINLTETTRIRSSHLSTSERLQQGGDKV